MMITVVVLLSVITLCQLAIMSNVQKLKEQREKELTVNNISSFMRGDN